SRMRPQPEATERDAGRHAQRPRSSEDPGDAAVEDPEQRAATEEHGDRGQDAVPRQDHAGGFASLGGGEDGRRATRCSATPGRRPAHRRAGTCGSCCAATQMCCGRIRAHLTENGPWRDYMLPVVIDPFGQAELRYRELLEERKQGGLDPRGFRSAVRELRVLDGEGREWSLGPENGVWYRRDRDRWMEAEPARRVGCAS